MYARIWISLPLIACCLYSYAQAQPIRDDYSLPMMLCWLGISADAYIYEFEEKDRSRLFERLEPMLTAYVDSIGQHHDPPIDSLYDAIVSEMRSPRGSAVLYNLVHNRLRLRPAEVDQFAIQRAWNAANLLMYGPGARDLSIVYTMHQDQPNVVGVAIGVEVYWVAPVYDVDFGHLVCRAASDVVTGRRGLTSESYRVGRPNPPQQFIPEIDSGVVALVRNDSISRDGATRMIAELDWSTITGRQNYVALRKLTGASAAVIEYEELLLWIMEQLMQHVSIAASVDLASLSLPASVCFDMFSDPGVVASLDDSLEFRDALLDVVAVRLDDRGHRIDPEVWLIVRKRWDPRDAWRLVRLWRSQLVREGTAPLGRIWIAGFDGDCSSYSSLMMFLQNGGSVLGITVKPNSGQGSSCALTCRLTHVRALGATLPLRYVSIPE